MQRAETRRLILSDIGRSDIDTICGYFDEAESRESVLWGQRISWNNRVFLRLETTQAKNIEYSERHILCFKVTIKESNQIIGVSDLSYSPRTKKGRIGWHYGHKYSGKGYATEVARELLRIAFEERSVHTIYADCFKSNIRNIRIFKKIGMVSVDTSIVRGFMRGLRYMHLQPTVRFKIGK